ncbi:hypothetical protein CR513_29449, partial [Mucuna pruriens]
MSASSSSLEMSAFPFLSSLEREPKPSDYRQCALPFYHFKAEVLWVLGLAPSQLQPSGWAVIQAFRLICRFFGVVPTTSLLLYFYQSDAPTLASWIRLIPRPGRDLISEYSIPSSAFRPWFFKVFASERCLFATTAKSFPLYWQNVPSVDKVPFLS